MQARRFNRACPGGGGVVNGRRKLTTRRHLKIDPLTAVMVLLLWPRERVPVTVLEPVGVAPERDDFGVASSGHESASACGQPGTLSRPWLCDLA